VQLNEPRSNRATLYRAFGKRALDLALTVPLLVILTPALLVTALVVAASIGRPILFRHRRPGLGERPFEMLKFRTMIDRRDAAGRLLPDSERLTRVGRVLRSWSFDEWPQLWNVIRGEMSLVGPRPLLSEYLGRYADWQRRRHLVVPGNTGWAQVHGRNALTWSDKFAADVWYVDHLSFALDVRILALTVWKLLKREGITQPGHATIEEFHGGPS
jgi:sugar transferase EpsL